MTSATFAPPVVATYGAEDPVAPLVVLLHGRGSNERDIVGLASHLPTGPAYASVRAPIVEGGGFAWFANRGIGRPVAEPLRDTMDWFRGWLDDAAPAGRPVLLVGFSGGAAFAGGLALDDPSRYAGAAILYGTLPFDAGLLTDAGRLANLPLFIAQGDGDHVIPRELLDRTWDYVLAKSGAPTVAQRQPGGHQLTADTVRELGDWIAHRVSFVGRHAATPAGPPAETPWPTLAAGELPARRGTRPEVSWTIPQQQRTQNAPRDLQERLFEDIRQLPGVDVGPSHIPVPGARGFVLREGSADEHAFLVPSSRSSRTCTRRTTAPCTWCCPPSWRRTSRPRAGGDPTCGRAPASPPASCSSMGPGTTTRSPSCAASSWPATPMPPARPCAMPGTAGPQRTAATRTRPRSPRSCSGSPRRPRG